MKITLELKQAETGNEACNLCIFSIQDNDDTSCQLSAYKDNPLYCGDKGYWVEYKKSIDKNLASSKIFT